MNNKNNVLEDDLPKNCCTFCSNLTLEGPDKNFKYSIKCIITDEIPKPTDYCKYFDQEHTNLTTYDLDSLYLNFLETSLRVKYEDYRKSLYWQLFSQKILEKNNYSCFYCNSSHNVDVYHINRKLGRESEEDVVTLCSNCIPKYT